MALTLCAFWGLDRITAWSRLLPFATVTGTPDVFEYPVPFPLDLHCSDLKKPGSGPTWRGVTVGVSTLSDLASQLTDLGYTEKELIKDVWYFTSPEGIWVDYVHWVSACVSDDVVSVVSIVTISAPTSVYLTDFVARYGIPDAVTWADQTTRVAFWFKAGVAVEVFIAEPDPAFGSINQIVYFPYQSDIGYETRWPFSRTARYSGHPDYSLERNPFDFGAMIKTITAQPSRTPTTTFTPRPTRTPTAVSSRIISSSQREHRFISQIWYESH